MKKRGGIFFISVLFTAALLSAAFVVHAAPRLENDLNANGYSISDLYQVCFSAGGCQTTPFLGTTQTVNAANVSSGSFGANTGGGNYTFPASVTAGSLCIGSSCNSTGWYSAGTGMVLSGTTFGIGTQTWDDVTQRAPSVAGYGSGFYQTNTASPSSGWPAGASSWWHLINAQHTNTSNNYALQIAGSFYDQNLYFRKTNGSGTTAWSKFVAIDGSGNVSLPGSGIWNSSGNVGMGITSPSQRLDVSGNAKVSGWIAAGGATPGGNGGTSGYGINLPSTTNDSVRIIGEHDGGDTSNGIFQTGDNTNDGWYFREIDCCGGGTLDYMRVARTGVYYVGEGNFGIGTTGPGYKLDVSGNARITGGLYLNPVSNGTLSVGGGSIGGNDAVAYFEDQSNGDWGVKINKGVYDYGLNIAVGSAANYAIQVLGSGSEKFRLYGNGNATFAGTVTAAGGFSGSYAGTINAANVSSGSFGANTGGGDYTFPGLVYSKNGSLSSYTQSVGSNWGSYVNTQVSGRGAIIMSVYVSGGNSTWKGTFLIQGETSYTPNETWNNAKLMSWAGYNAAVDDVQALIMSTCSTTSYCSNVIVLKTNPIASSAGVTVTVTLTGSGANTINLVNSGTSAPYAYTMASSANTYQIYQMSTGNVGIGTANPGSYKLYVNGGNVYLSNDLYVDGIYLSHGSGENNIHNVDQIIGYNDIRFNPAGSAILGRWNTTGLRIGSDGAAVATLDVEGTGYFTGNVRIDSAITAGVGTLRDSNGGWVRTYGDTGWYSQNYGGGWYMTDTTWIRSYGNKSIYQNAGILRTDGTLQVGSGGATLNVPNNGDFNYKSGAIFGQYSTGNVGINNTNPTAKLDVGGMIRATGSGSPSTGVGAELQWTGSVAQLQSHNRGNGTWQPLQLNASTIGLNAYSGGITTNADLTVNGGTGKINVGTVDPIYTIGGKQFATYGAETIGVNVDAKGVADLQASSCDSGVCAYRMDIGGAPEGSDLWLFARTTDLKDNFGQMMVLLTPSFDGRVWYEKDPQNMTITIYGTSAGEVSYRLSAPRFDASEWGNVSNETSTEGFNLDELLK